MDDSFRLPNMGEGVYEATVVKWLKKPGDAVLKDEAVLEVATDKVDTEIVAPRSGFLIAVFVKEGTTLNVDALLGQIAATKDARPMDPGEDKSAPPSQGPAAEPPKKQHEAFVASQPAGLHLPVGERALASHHAGIVRASPLVRKLAREYQVALGDVPGSGLYGRITKEDLLAFLADPAPKHFLRRDSLVEPSQQSGKFLKLEKRNGQEYVDGVPVRREAMSRIRRLTAEHMLASVQISPHVTTTFAVDLSSLIAFKKGLDSKASEQSERITLTAFFIAAAANALRAHPVVNASVDGADILYKKEINIGCAVATPSGLIVPVLKNLDQVATPSIARRLNDLAKRARAKELKADEVTGGTFSLSNPGVYGSLHSQPIINQPQVAIMSIGAISQQLSLGSDEQLTVRSIVQIGLTFDHRVLDGEGGALFLAEVRDFLEDPNQFSNLG